MHAAIARALARADAEWERSLERLSALVRIPSCSFPGWDPAAVVASAEATAQWLADAGFPSVEVVAGGGPHPAVIAEDRRAGPQRPTLLLYAHHDVQPPRELARWRSPPFAPQIRDGRLYGRGAADDKGGILCHAAAAAAWNATAGAPPLNLLALIEGEEEIGSPHLPELLAAHGERLRADAVLVMDAGNIAAGLPCITLSLRGLVVAELEVRALAAPLHSGIWGGTVPDPALVLARVLSGLADERGWLSGERADSARSWAEIPYHPAWFAAAAGLAVPGAALASAAEACAAAWERSALTVTACAAGDLAGGNAIAECARARLALRVAPGEDSAAAAAALCARIEALAPPTVRCAVQTREAVPGWRGDAAHPLFWTLRRALAEGYGRPPLLIGCGATIPLVPALARRYPGVPLLLVGIEDPQCAAHAENEGLLLDDARAALRSEIILFGLLAEGGEGLAG
ncbi:MAG: M20/M25/M40 family metallo-hydrolase [Planctomycetota bacterium]|nr:M20/M25/M40 family metallo-hydrolase [Planctomycetota bacterium]